ncbi:MULTISPECIES: FadR/GntR family transcriptional regulator [Gracilibacillus]|uniref:FadR/GntR family transcriptional regulator n=1 Tax=Gracilibacillus TaxID=74385 RepID=UPI000826BE61|nr:MULTISPECIES: FadR/GntR family transcriptional regulator [Gracilibacillus]
MDIKSIKKTNIVEEVFQQIIQQIQNGEWQVGDKLPSENQLCEMFSVSRISVRSAMQKLRQMGIITTKQGQGSFVSGINHAEMISNAMPTMDISEKELLDILEFREIIEFKCIDLATERATDEDIKELELALEKMLNNKDDYKRYTQADFEFHLTVAKASKNQFLYAVMKNTKAYYYYLEELNRVFGVDHKTLEGDSIDGHIEQLNCIKNRDPEGVKNILRKSMAQNLRDYRASK